MNNQWILLLSTPFYIIMLTLCLSCRTQMKDVMTFEMNDAIRRTYSIVYHSTTSKHFVPGRDDSDSENPDGGGVIM